MSAFDALIDRPAPRDEDEVDRAAYSLGDLGDRGAVPIRAGLLETAESARLRNAAAVGLRELADPQAVEPILIAIRHPRNVNHVGTLIWALETLDARQAVVDLADFVSDGAYEAAWMAVVAIRGFLGAPDPELRRQSLTILEDGRTQDAIEDWRQQMIADAVASLERYAAPA